MPMLHENYEKDYFFNIDVIGFFEYLFLGVTLMFSFDIDVQGPHQKATLLKPRQAPPVAASCRARRPGCGCPSR